MTQEQENRAGFEWSRIGRQADKRLEDPTLYSQFYAGVHRFEVLLEKIIKEDFIPTDASLSGRHIGAEFDFDTEKQQITLSIVEAPEEGSNVILSQGSISFFATSSDIDAEQAAYIIDDIEPRSGNAVHKDMLANAIADVYNAHKQAFSKLPYPKPELSEDNDWDDLGDEIHGSPINHCYINLNGSSMIKVLVDNGFNPASRTERRISERIIVTHPSCAGRKLKLHLMMNTEADKDEIEFSFLEDREYTGQENFDFNEAAKELYSFTLSLHDACGEEGWNYYYRKKSTGTIDVPILDKYDAEADDRRMNNMHEALAGRLARALTDKEVIGIGGDRGYTKEIARNLIAIFTEYKSLATNDHLLRSQLKRRLGFDI